MPSMQAFTAICLRSDARFCARHAACNRRLRARSPSFTPREIDRRTDQTGEGETRRHELLLGGSRWPTFMAAELFKAQAGVDMLHVPYKGGGPALTAVIAGEVSVHFPPIATALPNIQASRLRGLAVTTAQRVPLMPELPTIADSGLRGFESGNWYGLDADPDAQGNHCNDPRRGCVGIE